MVTMENNKLPKWIHTILDPSDLEKIAASIHEAENETDGEIVPMIVRRSWNTNQFSTICALTSWLLGLLFALAFELQNHWFELTPVYITLILFGWWIGKRDKIIRILCSQKELDDQVLLRAQAEFFKKGIGKTERSTGILIFLSLAEHRAVVLADEAIAKHYPPETWLEIIEIIIEGIKCQNLPTAMCSAIHRCGELIKLHFPAQIENYNELANQVIIED